MALALALRDLLPGLELPPQVFDPAFTPIDLGLLASIGFQVCDQGGFIQVISALWCFVTWPCYCHMALLVIVTWPTLFLTKVIDINEGGRRAPTKPTVFYMPHCEHLLYDALLSHNEGQGTLGNVIMLGNSLEG